MDSLGDVVCSVCERHFNRQIDLDSHMQRQHQASRRADLNLLYTQPLSSSMQEENRNEAEQANEPMNDN